MAVAGFVENRGSKSRDVWFDPSFGCKTKLGVEVYRVGNVDVSSCAIKNGSLIGLQGRWGGRDGGISGLGDTVVNPNSMFGRSS